MSRTRRLKIEGGSHLSWVNFNQEDISEALKRFAELAQDSTVDVLGLGPVADKLSELFFPATSTLHTRLRYVIFIPAVISAMVEHGDYANPREVLRKLQMDLMKALEAGGEKSGVIGRTTEDGPVQAPSRTYWNAVNNLEILSTETIDQADLLHSLTVDSQFDEEESSESDKIAYRKILNPAFIAIAKPLFSDFKRAKLKSPLKFALTLPERKYLREKLKQLYPYALSTRLLDLSHTEINNLGSPFQISGLDPKVEHLLNQAEQFSSCAMGATYAYRYALCDHLARQFRGKPAEAEWTLAMDKNLEHFDNWRARIRSLRDWSLTEFRKALADMREFEGLKKEMTATSIEKFSELDSFVTSFLEKAMSRGPSEDTLQSLKKLMMDREYEVKKARSHFEDPTMDIPDVTQSRGETLAYQYTFRFRQGKNNALDLCRVAK